MSISKIGCLVHIFQAIDVEHAKLMDHPSNSVAVWGFLKPTFIDEELYLRRLFNDEDSDGDTSDCKGNGMSIVYSTTELNFQPLFFSRVKFIDNKNTFSWSSDCQKLRNHILILADNYKFICAFDAVKWTLKSLFF